MPPEQLVDVPVPQIPRGLAEGSFMRSSAGCRRWRRRQGGVSRMPFWKRRRWMRTRKRWRALVSFLTSVHVAGAGTCKSAAFALVDGSAPLHTMSLSSIQTHGSAMWWWVAGVWVQGLDIPCTLLGCPCRSPGQLKFSGARGQGLGIPCPLPGCLFVVRQQNRS